MQEPSPAPAAAPAPAAPDTPLAAPTPDPAPAAPVSEPPSLDPPPDSDRCLLHPVCLGPVATVLSTLPFFGLGVRANIGEYFGASLDYHLMPTLSISQVSFGSGMFSATARVYPLKGKFFVGAGFGYLHYFVRVRADEINAEAKVGVPIALINVGMTGKSGFVFGMDAALVLPLSKMRASTTATPGPGTGDLPRDELQARLDEQREEVTEDVNRVLSKIPFLIQLNLVRIGYIF